MRKKPIRTDQDGANLRMCEDLRQEEPTGPWQGTLCEVFFWRHAIPSFTVTYEPYKKGD